MKGEKIRQKLKDEGYVLEDIAESMNISPQSLHSKLKSNDVKVGVLEDIAAAINKSIYFFFDHNLPASVNEPFPTYGKGEITANEVADKVYNKLLPHLSKILNKQIIIEAALAKLLIDSDGEN
jgi:transcriptional regulator with XRE-family HTH domain